MVKQREGYRIIVREPAKSRIAQGLCPVCETPKSEWKRTQRYTCCSIECTEQHQRDYVEYGWQSVRLKALKRDNFTCVKCGVKPMKEHFQPLVGEDGHWVVKNTKATERKDYYEGNMETVMDDSKLIGDHIIPIALGGDEWDLNNIQTLCIDCNKIKTAKDAKNIAKLRFKEKKWAKNKTLL